jgi:hypothetical protein
MRTLLPPLVRRLLCDDKPVKTVTAGGRAGAGPCGLGRMGSAHLTCQYRSTVALARMIGEVLERRPVNIQCEVPRRWLHIRFGPEASLLATKRLLREVFVRCYLICTRPAEVRLEPATWAALKEDRRGRHENSFRRSIAAETRLSFGVSGSSRGAKGEKGLWPHFVPND